MGSYGYKEGKYCGKVQINFGIAFTCYVDVAICYV